MSSSQSSEVDIICLSKPLDTLMNENIMDKEVSHAVKKDPESYRPSILKTGRSPEEEQEHTWNGKNEEEGIVPFHPGWKGFFGVMVSMQNP
jgi:hypothetical protein